MRLALFISLVFSSVLLSQENEERISMEIGNRSIEEVLTEIESMSNFQFYYPEEWLDFQVLDKTYSNQSVEMILDDIFKGTDINFFISWDNRIILTKNNSIYDSLREGFLVEKKSIEDSTVIKDRIPGPTLLAKEKNSTDEILETISIGKERPNETKELLTISGQVTNVMTGEAIPDLTLIVRSLNIGVSTDESGFYTLRLPPGVHLLETSAMGIETTKRNIILYNDGQLDLSLNESLEQLDEVTVQADVIRNIEDTSTGTTGIGSETSKNVPLVLGERDVLKIATTLPGITTAGEGSAGFNVRGGKTDQNLILLDDAVVYNPSHFFGFFQAINPIAINDLVVHKGSIPAEFGGRLSSVFEISSKNPSTGQFKGEASLGPVTTSAVFEIPVKEDKSGLLVGGRGTYSDWVLKALDEENLGNSQASFYDIIAKYDHQINDRNEIQSTAYYSKDRFSITSDSLFSYSNRLFSTRWNRTLGPKSSASLMLHNSQYRFNIDFDGSLNANFKQGFQIDETEVKAQFRSSLNSEHTLGYGISGKLYSVRPGEIRPRGPNDIIQPLEVAKEQGLEAAVFISNDLKVTEDLQLDLGLRYSFYGAMGPSIQREYLNDIPKSETSVADTKTFGNFEIFETYGGPELRISARYLVSDSLSIKASFNNAYQFIHTLSNNTTVSPIDTWKLSDRNIKPQRANQFAPGLYSNSANYELSLEGFYKVQNNIVDFKTGAQLLLNPNIETKVLQGQGKAYGLELLVRKNDGNLNGWLGYTYSRSFLSWTATFPRSVSMMENFSLRISISLMISVWC
ncbi:TonB-dependent receptor [Maribacter litopenaei]|uniref:TonB-dependent receptor n=1 Tax=Maribacter litopenaei TaxID=2976127 RepID=UPI00308427DC